MKTTPCEDAVRMLEAHLDAGATWRIRTIDGKVHLAYEGPLGDWETCGESIPEACAAMVTDLAPSYEGPTGGYR